MIDTIGLIVIFISFCYAAWLSDSYHKLWLTSESEIYRLKSQLARLGVKPESDT